MKKEIKVYNALKKFGMIHAEMPKYLFRVLRDDENPKETGILAKDMNSTETWVKHVSDGSCQTSWISFTSSYLVAVLNALKTHSNIAIIDTSKLSKENVDSAIFLQMGNSMLKKRYENYAKSSQEVLIQYSVSSEAVLDVLSYQRFVQLVNEETYVKDSLQFAKAKIRYDHIHADCFKQASQPIKRTELFSQSVAWKSSNAFLSLIKDTQFILALDRIGSVVTKIVEA